MTTLTPPASGFRARAAGLALVLLAAGPLLGGCDSLFGKKLSGAGLDLACPKVGILRDANQVTLYRPGGSAAADVQARAQIVDYAGNCTYDETGVTVDVSLILVAERGPALVGASVPLSYFAAVIDPAGTPVTRQQFDTTVDFTGNVPRAGSREDLQPHIPLPKAMDARNYQVLVGFQLTGSQLEANRKANSSASGDRRQPAPNR
ncbi:MAG: hypothetical protein WCO00_07005 [Rhodospirillaceae bacterium]